MEQALYQLRFYESSVGNAVAQQDITRTVASLKETINCAELSKGKDLTKSIRRKDRFFFLQINRIGDSELSQ